MITAKIEEEALEKNEATEGMIYVLIIGFAGIIFFICIQIALVFQANVKNFTF